MGTFSTVLKGGGSWHSKVSCTEKLKKSIVNSRSLSFPESVLRPGTMHGTIHLDFLLCSHAVVRYFMFHVRRGNKFCTLH